MDLELVLRPRILGDKGGEIGHVEELPKRRRKTKGSATLTVVRDATTICVFSLLNAMREVLHCQIDSARTLHCIPTPT